MRISRPESRRWADRSAAGSGRYRRSLVLESLEDRRMLAGDAVELLPDTFTLPEDSPWAELDVLANDAFPDDYSGARRISSASYGSLGGVVRLADEGTLLEYQPPAGVHGEDSLVYIVDGQYVGQVTVTIEPPLADDTFDVVQHSPEVRLDLLKNDPFFRDYAGERVITAVSAASMASSVRIADGGKAVFYSPAPDAQGVERFRYLVDGLFEAIVTLHVHRPVRDDFVSVEQNSDSNPLDVLRNDSYVDSHNAWHDIVDRVTSVSATQEGGTVSIVDNGSSLVYSPPQDFVGTDSFAYLADGVHEATAYVTVTRPVRPDNLQVHQQSSQQVLDVLANDFWTNAYSGNRQITSVTAAQHGAVEIAPNGRWLVYTPADLFTGMDRFEYTVDDILTTSVAVEVEPLAQRDSYRFGVSPYVTQYTLGVLQNDLFDRSYTGPRRITSVTTPPDGGSVEILDGARSLRFTSAEATTGGASFSYVVDDLFEARVSVWIDVYLAADSVVVKQNSHANSLDVLGNDFGLRYNIPLYNGPRTITSVDTPESGGTVALEADGRTVRYTPPVDFLGMDRFSYTVDGVQSATVSVRVIGYARDDRFRVDPESADNSLRVLVNDRIDPSSAAARRVASVTDTTAGGVVTVSDAGQTILYAPPAEFSGTDTFAYYLDNDSRGEVTVEVTSDLERLLPRFGDQAELEQYLIDDALERYAHLFGQPAWGPFVDWQFVTLSGTRDGDPAPESDRSHSETNVQVAGVDEGDIIEVDADYVYIVAQDSLVIADAWPAEQLHVASRTELAGRPLVEYLRDDRLTMISDTSVWIEVAGRLTLST
jgi:hypothetical protein